MRHIYDRWKSWEHPYILSSIRRDTNDLSFANSKIPYSFTWLQYYVDSRLLFCLFAQMFLSEIIKYIIFWSWPPPSSWLDYTVRRKWYHSRPSHHSRIYTAYDRYWVRDTTCHSNFSSFRCKSIMDRSNLSTSTRLVKIFTIE